MDTRSRIKPDEEYSVFIRLYHRIEPIQEGAPFSRCKETLVCRFLPPGRVPLDELKHRAQSARRSDVVGRNIEVALFHNPVPPANGKILARHAEILENRKLAAEEGA